MSQEVIDLVSDDEEEQLLQQQRQQQQSPTNDSKPSQDEPRKNNKKGGDVNQKLTSSSIGHAAAAAAATTTTTEQKNSKRQRLSSEDKVHLEPDDNGVITYGILEQMKSYCTLSRAKTCLQQRRSGTETTSTPTSTMHLSTLQHIQQKDKWSCGYRNLQMMLSAIIPHLPPSHVAFQRIPRRQPHPSIPSVRYMQQALEQAWVEGFDPRGAQHYQHKLVDSRSKIGAVEVANLFWYWGLDASVVQFVYCDESRRLLPRFISAYFSKVTGREGCPFCPNSVKSPYCANGLLHWSSSFLSDGTCTQQSSCCDCPLLPIYLQWEGHSVSVVGIEADGETLLVFDPLKQGRQIMCEIAAEESPKPLRLSSSTLTNKDTQIILCTLHSTTNVDRTKMKREGNILTAAKEAVHRKQLEMIEE
jgi:hypothetical protein